jgi:hypothetical protein
MGPLPWISIVLIAAILSIGLLAADMGRARIRAGQNFIAYLARLLRCQPCPMGRSWLLQGLFRGKKFQIGTIRSAGPSRPPIAIRLIGPGLDAHADLFLDFRRRSLASVVATVLGQPILNLGNEHLDRCLAIRCNDAGIARQLRDWDEFRTALHDFWCLGQRGILRFANGQLTYLQRRWAPGPRTAAEVRHCLFLLCDLCDLIRSREWSQGGTFFQKHANAAQCDEQANGRDEDAGQAAGQGEDKVADVLRVDGG